MGNGRLRVHTPGTNSGTKVSAGAGRHTAPSSRHSTGQADVLDEEQKRLCAPNLPCVPIAPEQIVHSISHTLGMGGQSIHPCTRQVPKHEITTFNVLFAWDNRRQGLHRCLSLVVCAHLMHAACTCSRIMHGLSSGGEQFVVLCDGAVNLPQQTSDQWDAYEHLRAPFAPCPAQHFISPGGQVEPPGCCGCVQERLNLSSNHALISHSRLFDCLHSAAIKPSQRAQTTCASSPPAAPSLHRSSADSPSTAALFIELQPRLY